MSTFLDVYLNGPKNTQHLTFHTCYVHCTHLLLLCCCEIRGNHCRGNGKLVSTSQSGFLCPVEKSSSEITYGCICFGIINPKWQETFCAQVQIFLVNASREVAVRVGPHYRQSAP